MDYQTKTKEELIGELEALHGVHGTLVELYAKGMDESKNAAAELLIANQKLAFENKEKARKAAELLYANEKMAVLIQEKEKRVAELKSINEELEQFAYVASHDLQEPLRMISSYTQLLERRYKDQLDQDARDFIHYAVDGAIRMQKLINDLLEYSRISTHAKAYQEVDAAYIVEQVIANLQLMIEENSATITVDPLPVIKGEESQMIRLFQNLMVNAIKFKKKSEAPRIHISCKAMVDSHEFSVTDNGIGIDMQYKERVFIIFQRLHSAKDYPGTGIGLALNKRIVEQHGGTIRFESKENEGTTFYFTLPL